MIDPEIALAELNRLSEYDGFHRLTEEAMKDLLIALRAAETPELLHRVIDDIKADEIRTEMPTSGYLRHLIREETNRGQIATSYPGDQIAPPPKCRLCGDTGLEVVQRGMYTSVRPCDCRKPAAGE
jgi:hypothetical protein